MQEQFSQDHFEYVKATCFLESISRPQRTVQDNVSIVLPIVVLDEDDINSFKIISSDHFDFIDDTFYIKGKFRTMQPVKAHIIKGRTETGDEYFVKFSQWSKILEKRNLNQLADAKLVKCGQHSAFIQMIPSFVKDKLKSVQKPVLSVEETQVLIATAIKRNISTPDEIKELINLYISNR